MCVHACMEYSDSCACASGLSPCQVCYACRLARQSCRLYRAELLCNVKQVARVRSGVRALPQKTAHGAIPLAGNLPSSGNMKK